MRGYFFLAVESRKTVGSSCASCILREQHFTRDQPSSKRGGDVGLGPKPPKLRAVALHSAECRESYTKLTCCCENVVDTARCCHLPSYDMVHAVGEGD